MTTIATQTSLLDDDGPAPGEFLVPHGAAVQTCHSCGAPIVWGITPKGHAIPLNISPLRMVGKLCYARTHYATCPDAKEWRRAR